MKKICVLIRVYNRIDDLKYCIDIIRDTWVQNSYFILVAFNGGGDGYHIHYDTLNKIDLLLEIENNTGHFKGNSQLLLGGLPHIPVDCDFTVILEADTWLYGDDIITKYAGELERAQAVWASAQFFRYVRNLATDFAIIKTSFIKSHPEIFKFEKTPEYYVANYLHTYNLKSIYITELMPINLPRYVKHYPFASKRRFFAFPKGKMVTHHIEHLKNGMDEKKRYFNIMAGSPYFKLPGSTLTVITRSLLKLSISLTILIPYKGWFVKQKA